MADQGNACGKVSVMIPSRRCAVQWLFHVFASVSVIIAPWWAGDALAQTTTTTTPTPATTTYGLSVTWANTGGHLDCYGSSDCKPINIASCASAHDSTTAWSVDLRVVTSPTTTLLPTTTIYYWVETTAAGCKWAIPPTLVKQKQLNVNDPQVVGPNATTPFIFPGDMNLDSYTTVDLLAAVENGTNFCDHPIDNGTYQLCFAVDTAAPSSQIDNSDLRGWLSIPIDTKAPNKPDVITATAGDQLANVTTKISGDSAGDTVSSFSARYRKKPADGDATAGQACTVWADTTFATVSGDAVAGAATIRLSSLENGVTYEICSIAYDAAGNASPGSDIIEATTQDECDFIECYPEEVHTGYCGAAGMPSLLFMILGMGLLRMWAVRRKKPCTEIKCTGLCNIVMVIMVGSMIGSTAMAAAPQKDVIPVRRERDITMDNIPRWGVDIRFGAFKPTISNNDAALDLYKNIFEQGHDKSLVKHHPLMKSLEAAWYFWRAYGLLGVYGRVGHWSVTGKSLRCSTADCSKDSVTSTQATTDNNLIIVPFQAGLVYKMDLFKRYWGIPLVPYVKGGFDYDLWWLNAGGSVAHTKPGGHAAKGGMWGYHGSGGLAVNLDFLEPGAARHGRSSSNILDSYVYFDVQKSVVNDFGKHNRLNLSGMQYSIGIALDFM